MTTPAKNIMRLDNSCIPLFKIELEQNFEQRESKTFLTESRLYTEEICKERFQKAKLRRLPTTY